MAYDVVIVGGGPAGLAAEHVALRALPDPVGRREPNVGQGRLPYTAVWGSRVFHLNRPIGHRFRSLQWMAIAPALGTKNMKIVVIGGSGRIGEKLVYNLRQDDYMVREASPTFGVNTITREGLDAALDGAQVVVDVSQSPTLAGDDAIRFFETSGRHLAAASEAAGVEHRLALSIVGVDRLASGYFRAKKIQEDLLKASSIPFTILRATQFFEFIADVVQDGDTADVVISPALAQPIAAEDIAEALADLATGPALNTILEVAGPDRFRLADIAAEVLTAYEDPRQIIADIRAPYFGAQLDDTSLLPGPGARVGTLRFEDWLRQRLQPAVAAAGAPIGRAGAALAASVEGNPSGHCVERPDRHQTPAL